MKQIAISLCSITLALSLASCGGGGSSRQLPPTGGDGLPAVAGQYLRTIKSSPLSCSNGATVNSNEVNDVVTITQEGSALDFESSLDHSDFTFHTNSRNCTLRSDASFVCSISVRYTSATDGVISYSGTETGQFYLTGLEVTGSYLYIYESYGLTCSVDIPWTGDKI